MREIKFRAWVTKIKSMGNVLTIDFWDAHEILLSGGYIFERSEVVLMQYIGLKDKKGKEIYEGDIVKTTIQDDVEGEIKTQGKIEFIGFGWKIIFNYYHPLDIEKTPWIFGLYEIDDCKCKGVCIELEIEVIGNIYENPELLEVTAKHKAPPKPLEK